MSYSLLFRWLMPHFDEQTLESIAHFGEQTLESIAHFGEQTLESIGALHGYLMERDRSKRLTEDTLRDDLETTGLVPPPSDVIQSNMSINQTDQSAAGSRQADQSGITNGVCASHLDSSVIVNGHMEDVGRVEIPDDLPPLEDDDDVVVT